MSLELARKRARTFFRYHKLELPVDVEALLSSYAIVEETYIPKEGDAVCVNHREKPHIFIKKNMSPLRKRFTYAHELGHLQIPSHTGMISCTTELPEQIDFSSYYRMEQEANAFAAELLMPAEWIRSLICRCAGVGDVIRQVVEKAQVSFSAAAYNIIPFLPPGYMIVIYNKVYGYHHVKCSADGEKPPLLYIKGEIDPEWVRINCMEPEIIKSDGMDLYVYRFKEVIGEEVLRKMAQQFATEKECAFCCQKITTARNISFAHFLRDFVPLLPPGFILKIICRATGSFLYTRSPETYTRPEIEDDAEKETWLSEKCEFYVHSAGRVVDLKVWYFVPSFKMKGNPGDKRDSKEILRGIIDRQYLDPSLRVSMFGRVNGIIGSVNSHYRICSRQQFYDVLMQKFNSRPDLEDIAGDGEFEQFLYNKIEEIYAKKASENR